LLQAQYSVPPKSPQVNQQHQRISVRRDRPHPTPRHPSKTKPPSTVSTKPSGRLDADTTYELDIAGRAGIPTDALSVTANLVAVNPSGPGYLTVYPCGFDKPLASALNYMPGVNNANEFSVPIGDNGDICIYTHAETDIVVDIYGYYIAPAAAEPEPPAKDGQDGADGADGQDAESPARVIWVADDGTGDFLKLSTALASITDATATKPYVIKIAPGVYEEDERVVLKDDVDVEGSGQGITTIECACSSNSNGALNAAVVSATDVTAEIRHLTINNTGGDKVFSIGLFTDDVDDEFSMLRRRREQCDRHRRRRHQQLRHIQR